MVNETRLLARNDFAEVRLDVETHNVSLELDRRDSG